MSIRLLFFTGILLLGYKAMAQRDGLSTKYREDQFYISFGLQLQQENISGFKQNGFSNNFQVGFVRDIPLHANGRTAIGLGLGYAYNRLISNLNLDSEDENPTFSIKGNDENRQTYSSIVVPLSLRFRTSTPDRTDFWRVYGGMKYML
ncbi:MAG: outer membrane beta-barrel protein, partial [Flavobacteriaceae bacterium]